MSKIYLLIIFSIFFIYSCSVKTDNFLETGNTEFSILIPENLIQPNEIQEGSILNLIEDTSDYLNGLSVVVYEDSIKENLETISIYDYYNFVANNLLDETLEAGNLVTPIDTIVNGYKSLFFTICGLYNRDSSNQNVCFYSGIFEGKNKFFEVTVWCSENNKQKYLTSINKILGSFKEKENKK
jgi:hypothetical protein